MGLKRFIKKVTKPIGKAVKKIVPKELAGIMQVAAPLAGPYAPLVYAAGAYKQSGKINPIALATMALPYIGTTGGISGLRYNPAGTAGVDFKTARDFLGLRNAQGLRGSAERFLFGTQDTRGLGDFAGEEGFVPKYSDQTSTGLASQGLLGSGGEFDLKSSKLLSSTDPKTGAIKLSPTKIATAVTAGLSLSQTQAQIEEEGIEDGLSSAEIARLQAEAAEMWKDFDTTAFRPNVAQGGLMRTNYALGSRPTEQESGLGGLPIEADMRYTGGFMPYGAKEKADDVPARLSKNEFVFTADAVRGAGGGDINTGAKRMYQSMKQLEQMGKRA